MFSDVTKLLQLYQNQYPNTKKVIYDQDYLQIRWLFVDIIHGFGCHCVYNAQMCVTSHALYFAEL